MRTQFSEVFDLALTQAIEHYMEMEPDEVYEAIAKDWPEQTAILLIEFFFKTTCGNCGGVPDFIEIERESGSSVYIVPLCACETPSPDGDDL